MKQLSNYIFGSIILAFLTLFACGETSENSVEIKQDIAIIKKDSIRKKKEFHPAERITSNQLNYTDENGLKQGKWEELGWQDAVIATKNYVNDTLQGAWYGWDGIQIRGTYKNGKKVGYERWFYGNDSDTNTLALGYYENDSALWFAHPTADHGLLILSKGMSLQADSCYLKVPFRDGSLWYEGLYLDKKAVGKHKVFYPNGVLQGVVDYSTETLVEYDSLGAMLQDISFRHYKMVWRFGALAKRNRNR